MKTDDYKQVRAIQLLFEKKIKKYYLQSRNSSALLSERLEVDDVVGHEDSAAGEGGFEDHRVVLGREADVFGDSDAVDAEHSESFGDAGREHLVEEQGVRRWPARTGAAHPASRPCSRSQRRRAWI